MKIPSQYRDPTRTGRIRKAWFKEINAKYNKLAKDSAEKLKELATPSVSTNAEIGLNASQQRIYMAWLTEQIALIQGELPPNNWQNQYQFNSYMQALTRTRESLIAQGAQLAPTTAELSDASGITSFTATPALSTSLTGMANIHQDSLEFLFTRSYESLKNWNDQLAKDVRMIAFDAVKNGEGIRETSKKITERTRATKSRAELIARTELNSAYVESALNETKRASEELGEEINNRWVSALSPTTRHNHASWHGKIYDEQEVRKRKQPPNNYNCKCSIIPVIAGVSDTPARNEKFTKQRKQFEEAEDKLE